MENNQQINWQEEIAKITEAWKTSPIGSYMEFVNQELNRPLTLKEKIFNIPYYFGYWLAYPVLRLAYKIWDGIKDAYLDAFEI